MRPSVNSNGGGSPVSPSSGGGAGGESSANKHKTGTSSSTSSTVFLRPHVYSYTCRGALHMESGNNATNGADTNTSSTGQSSGDIQNLQGLPLCNGIATKLRHVTTLPTARTNDEAIQMFQQVLPSTKVVASNDENAYERAAGNVSNNSGGSGGHHHDHHSATPTRGYDPNKSIMHSVSCYGSTDVNVLTVQEIETAPVGAADDNDEEAAVGGRSHRQQQQQQRQEFQDPFEAMLGSVFGDNASGGPGGIFGPFGGFSGGTSSRSVSQSTRVINGQTITTKEITTVDQNGKRHVEKETTIRNRDGTVEVVKDDGSGGGGEGETVDRSHRQRQQQQGFQDPFEAMLGSVFGNGSGAGGGPGGIFGPFGGFSGGASSRSVSQSTRVVNGQTITTKEVTSVDQNGKRHVEKETTIRNRDGTVEVIKDDGSGGGEGDSIRPESQNASQYMGQVFPPVATAFGGRSPFGPPHRIVRQSEPQVVAVVPECKLGVTVSNVETDTEGDTIASFRVGPVEVAVGDSYDIVEEDGDSSRQYGDGTATGQDDNSGDRRKKKEWNMDEIEAKLLSTMDKTAASMKKNAEMLSDAVSDDFPSRILKGGERVVGNFDKTLDRMAKLASDLYGWASGDSGRK